MAKGLKAKAAAAAEALRNFPDLGDVQSVAREIIAGLNVDIASHQRNPARRCTGGHPLTGRNRRGRGSDATAAEITSAQIWAQDVRLNAILEVLPAPNRRRRCRLTRRPTRIRGGSRC